MKSHLLGYDQYTLLGVYIPPASKLQALNLHPPPNVLTHVMPTSSHPL